MYMEMPYGIFTWSGHAKDKVIKFLRNKKQASFVSSKYVVFKLIQIGFKKSDIDECVFF